MMKKVFLVMFLLTSAWPAWAHHPTAVTFDVDRPQSITGTITKIRFQNPHVLVSLASADQQRWTIEFPSANALYRDGVNSRTLQVNDTITVVGFPARSGDPVLSAKQAVLPGGIQLVMTPEELEGHHSYAARYNNQNKRSLTGTVTRVAWSAPRAYLDLEVRLDPNAAPETWTVELGAPSLLIRSGWNIDSIKVQDTLTVVGALGRVSDLTMFATEATLPNGSKWIRQ